MLRVPPGWRMRASPLHPGSSGTRWCPHSGLRVAVTPARLRGRSARRRLGPSVWLSDVALRLHLRGRCTVPVCWIKFLSYVVQSWIVNDFALTQGRSFFILFPVRKQHSVKPFLWAEGSQDSYLCHLQKHDFFNLFSIGEIAGKKKICEGIIYCQVAISVMCRWS